jgi:agmatine/peptidylarginine deiminase
MALRVALARTAVRSFGLCVVLGAFVPWLASGTPAGNGARPWNPEPDVVFGPEGNVGFPRVVKSLGATPRVLRGDYEAPAELVLAYEPEWEEAIALVVRASRGQSRVKLLIHPADRLRPFVTQWSGQAGVTALEFRFDTPWVRDFGPLEVRDQARGVLWLDFDYSWERPGDDALPRWLSRSSRVLVEASSSVLDGGALASNGHGLCAISTVSLRRGGIAPDAGAELSRLFARLGCRVAALLPEIPDEPTGHADVVVQFLSAEAVAVAWLDPERHPSAAARLEQVVQVLTEAADLASEPLAIVRVPIEKEGAAYYSYVNASRLQSRLLVPEFSAPWNRNEQSAYRMLQSALPGVELVRIPADAMVRRNGGVHCVTLGLGHVPPRQRG